MTMSLRELPFRHLGGTGAVIRLALLNLLLNVLTLSFWRFWAKTRVRRFLWGNATAWGDPVEYTGSGRELFLGFLVALLAVFTPWAIALTYMQNLVAAGEAWAIPAVAALQALLLFLAAAGLYRARRYQMSRTRWRGIRGGQGGEAWRYGLMALGVGVATLLTLGWAWPWGEMKLARYRMANTTFGSQSFTCTSVSRPLYLRFAVTWLVAAVLTPAVLTLVAFPAAMAAAQSPGDPGAQALGVLKSLAVVIGTFPFMLLPYAWYRAAFYARLAEGTGFAGARFAFEAKGWDLMMLVFNNTLISVLSLGILKPWAALRVFRYACRHLEVIGEPDFAQVEQGAVENTHTGEGLAAVFDGAGEF